MKRTHHQSGGGAGRQRVNRYLIAAAGLATLLFASHALLAQVIDNARTFAIVAEAITANGVGSKINGDIGSPAGAASITGFPGSAVVLFPFSNHVNDANTIAARASLLALYNSAAMAPAGATDTNGNDLSISGPTVNGHYTPGRYTNTAGGVALIPIGQSITLDGAGTYVFSVANGLTANGNVILNGVDPCSVWWRVPTQATLNGTFSGTVVSDSTIALGSGATVVGRTLTTANGQVTLAGNNTIGGCSATAAVPLPTPVPAPPAPPVPVPELFIVKHHVDNFVAGTNGVYSIALFNSSVIPSAGAITVVDTLPAGLTFVSASGVGWTCAAAAQVVTCTTSAVATANGPFPNNINVTVLPSAAAVPAVTNTAVVSGGGDVTPQNNTTIDITIVGPAGTPVPTLSEWATIALVLMLGGVGVVALRRRTAV